MRTVCGKSEVISICNHLQVGSKGREVPLHQPFQCPQLLLQPLQPGKYSMSRTSHQPWQSLDRSSLACAQRSPQGRRQHGSNFWNLHGACTYRMQAVGTKHDGKHTQHRVATPSTDSRRCSQPHKPPGCSSLNTCVAVYEMYIQQSGIPRGPVGTGAAGWGHAHPAGAPASGTPVPRAGTSG
jgi:hypothetical protein